MPKPRGLLGVSHPFFAQNADRCAREQEKQDVVQGDFNKEQSQNKRDHEPDDVFPAEFISQGNPIGEHKIKHDVR